MSNSSDVWVYIEHDQNEIADVSLELLCKARELANQLGSKVGAILLGDNLSSIICTLHSYGADIVYQVEDRALKDYATLPVARMIIELTQKYSPEIILIGASLVGRDLAPRISAGLKCGLTADCTQLEIQNLTYRKKEYKNLLLQIRPAFGGNIIATIITPTARPQMASVRDGVMQLTLPTEQEKLERLKKGTIITHPFTPHEEEDSAITVLERVKFDKKVNLKKSEIIVAIGAGVQNQENLNLVKQLAQLIGAQLGATRAAVDKGLLTRDYQIGQTGITVRPKVYIACGISGAIQHRIGMSQSDLIVAFNNNPHAPIMKLAHYAVLGDLHQTLPQFIETLTKSAPKS